MLGGAGRSDVEAELHDVAVLHDVLLAGPSHWLASASTTVLAAGVLVVTTSMLGYATEGAAYLRAGDGADPTVAAALLDVANVAFALVWAALAVLLLAAAASRALPRGLATTAAVLGVVFLIAFAAPSLPVGEMADLALWVWIIAISVTPARRRTHPRSDVASTVDVR